MTRSGFFYSPKSDHSVIHIVALNLGMGDPKKDRDEHASDAENRQRAWEAEQARDRADEAEPPRDDQDDSSDGPPECHRRDCTEPAAFLVLERYQEETGHGAVEAKARLCRAHTAEESPTSLDGVYADYVFRVEPLPETGTTETA